MNKEDLTILTGLARWLMPLAAALLSGCAKSEPESSPEFPAPKVAAETISFLTNAPQLAAIKVEVAESRKLAVNHVTGRLYWNDEKTVRVFTPVGGRVKSVVTDIGQAVTRDGLLAEIDSPDFGQALAAARTAVGNLAAVDKALARARELLVHGAAARKDVEAAEATFIAAQAERDRAVAQLANYGGQLSSTNSSYWLRSPLAGIVVEKSINPGQELRPDMMLGNVPQTFNPLFTISDPTSLWLQVDVTEGDLPALQTGLSLSISCRAFPGKVFEGTLQKIGETLDASTRTVKARGLVANPDKLLKAEMYVTVDILQDTSRIGEASVEVSTRALFLRDNDFYLFVEVAPGQFQRQKVRVGDEKDGKISVTSGLTAGQRVVTEGALLLQALVEPAS